MCVASVTASGILARARLCRLNMGLRVGLIINPLAGVGGPIAQKGSDQLSLVDHLDGSEISLRAIARTQAFLSALGQATTEINWVAPSGIMGGNLLESNGISFCATDTKPKIVPDAEDTCAVVLELLFKNVDLIIFAGGDGTAADVARTVGPIKKHQLVLGIPAGVKIHSAVFAVNPAAAGELVASLVSGAILNSQFAQVRDLDERELINGRVVTHYKGELFVPFDGRYIQQIKQGGFATEALLIEDIAAFIRELIVPEAIVVFGPGRTMTDIQEALGLPATLLGVDVFKGSECLALDATAHILESLIGSGDKVLVFLTVIGGQGHILGRGNLQLTGEILKRVGRAAIHPVATKEKLASITGRKLLLDSGDPDIDHLWQGLIPVICGYREQVLYPLESIAQ